MMHDVPMIVLIHDWTKDGCGMSAEDADRARRQWRKNSESCKTARRATDSLLRMLSRKAGPAQTTLLGGEDDRALNQFSRFAQLPGPYVIPSISFLARGRDSAEGEGIFLAIALQRKMARRRGEHVFPAVSRRGGIDRWMGRSGGDQILAENGLAHQREQFHVGSSHDAHVDCELFRDPPAHELTL